MPLAVVRKYLKRESTSSSLLFAAAVLALILDNSPLASLYQSLFTTPFEISLGNWSFSEPFLVWINDGLMTFFFLLVGLELKREFVEGELSDSSKVLLPGFAALGGMLFPALIYGIVNFHQPTLKGWAIPVATDIAFALGVLGLFGRRIPIGLKLFLMALAIFDDIGAIAIIALFYSQDLSYLALLLAACVMVVLTIFNRFNVRNLIAYLLLGAVLWFFILKSGVHATLAGVLLAWAIPTTSARRLEEAIHPWVAFLIMPLFALANAGVSFAGIHCDSFLDHVTLGIILGLVLGKQIGVFSFVGIAIRLRWAQLPKNTNWQQIYAVALICGIGFTMSLFLGTLAFERELIYLQKVRLGVLVGSTISGMIGALVLYRALKKGG